MSHSRPFRFAVFLVFWLTGSGVMAADIIASVSRDDLARNETLQLVLEMSGESDAPPDLSPLYQDFEILWRSQSQSTRIINGNVQHRASLTLTLRPKRAGQLEIPALAFDRVATDPIPIEVTEAVAGAGEPEFGQRPMSPFEQVPGSGQFALPPPFQGYGPSRMPSSRWGNGAAGPLQPSAPAAPSPSLTMPGFQSGAQARTDQPLRSPPDIDKTSNRSTISMPASRWLTWIFGLGWLSTAVAWWWSQRGRRSPTRELQAQPVEAPAAEVEAEPPVVPNPKILAVKTAYEARDAIAARNALIDWAYDIWKEDSPNNLSTLARLCPEALSGAILKLDAAIYNPQPSDWWNELVWERLKDIEKKND